MQQYIKLNSNDALINWQKENPTFTIISVKPFIEDDSYKRSCWVIYEDNKNNEEILYE